MIGFAAFNLLDCNTLRNGRVCNKNLTSYLNARVRYFGFLRTFFVFWRFETYTARHYDSKLQDDMILIPFAKALKCVFETRNCNTPFLLIGKMLHSKQFSLLTDRAVKKCQFAKSWILMALQANECHSNRLKISIFTS